MKSKVRCVKTESNKKAEPLKDQERCPECDMPLEDSEVCYFCDWTRNVKDDS